jgi:hypothetical protein
MRSNWTLLAALAATLILPGDGALAAGERACKPFTAFSPADSREVYFTDVDGDGQVSVGDKRVGRRGLKDTTGNNIGDRYWIITVDKVDRPGTAVRRHQETVNIFEDGIIFASYDIGAPNKATDVTDRISLPQGGNAMTIVGGTGAYAGARGTIAAKVDGNDISFSFDLTCK